MRKAFHHFHLLFMSYRKVSMLMICMATMQLLHAQDKIKVYIFLSETCPICQSSTIELKEIYTAYHDKGVSFVGLFPNQSISTDETRQKFAKKYNIPFSLTADKSQQMAKHFAATNTPQVFVVRGKDNAILYTGKIDNSYESIGKRRQVVNDHYLKNALENILNNKPVDPARTEPVGCFISKT